MSKGRFAKLFSGSINLRKAELTAQGKGGSGKARDSQGGPAGRRPWGLRRKPLWYPSHGLVAPHERGPRPPDWPDPGPPQQRVTPGPQKEPSRQLVPPSPAWNHLGGRVVELPRAERLCATPFPHIISCNHHKTPYRKAGMSPRAPLGSGGSERLCNLPRDTQLLLVGPGGDPWSAKAKPVQGPLPRPQPHWGSRDHRRFLRWGQQHPLVKRQRLRETPRLTALSWGGI